MSVIVNGGGVIGAILALKLFQLSKGDLEIHLIEQHSPYYDNSSRLSKNVPRIIAMSRGAYAELVKMNIDIPLISVIRQIEVSEYNNNRVFINAYEYQLPELGYIIELNALRRKIFDFLHQKSSVNVYCPAVLQKITRNKSKGIVTLDNGQEIVSNLLIAADGAHSILASNCGMQWFRWNYRQIAVVTQIFTEFLQPEKAFEKFTKFGPLAILPMSNGFSFLIWCISIDKKKEVTTWTKKKFIEELQNIFKWEFGKILNIGKFCFYDLFFTRAISHISHRLALVGNAAQNLHPIAGQGFNLGLRDVIVLSKIIIHALSNNVDIGDHTVLRTYQRSRCLDQYRIIAITNGLLYLFNNNFFPLVLSRNLGLFCIGHSIFLRRLLIHEALCWKVNFFRK